MRRRSPAAGLVAVALLAAPLLGAGGCRQIAPYGTGAVFTDGGGLSDFTDGGGLRDQDDDARLHIVVAGDTKSKTFTDGLAGQTPQVYVLGVARYDILQGQDDPNPVTVFDHGENPADVDMLGSQEVGSVRIADLPEGWYTHGRVLLTKTVFTIQAAVHAFGGVVDTAVEVKVALSDTTIDGALWPQGQVSFTFAVLPVPVIATLSPLPEVPGAIIEQENGQYWMTFPFAQPLPVVHTPTSYEATITYDVAEGFRWQDQPSVDNQDGVFDIDVLMASFEPVFNVGTTGYRITWRAK